MCGLAFLHALKPSGLANDAQCNDAAKAIKNRGPDALSIERHSNTILIHSRLSIVGGNSGSQPLWNEDRDLAVLFNGEIYNFEQLKGELEKLGYVFKTETDGEVLLHGFKQWGSKLFIQLDGIFSCVFFDVKKNKTTLLRDRHGVKPLYFHVGNDRILAGSTLSAVEALGGLHKGGILPDALDQYLRLGFNFNSLTLNKDIHQLQPGTLLTWSPTTGKAEIQAYWEAAEVMKVKATSPSPTDGTQLIKEAIFSQCETDLPVGCFLSSGIDSSIISEVASSKLSLNHYTASFTDTNADEWNDVVAYNQDRDITLERIILDKDEMLDVKTFEKAFDTPFGDNASIPTMKLAQAASVKNKIILSGDGADELFFGYRNHKMLLLEHRLKKWTPDTLHPFARHIAKAYPSSKFMPSWLKASSTLNTFNRYWAESYTDATSVITRETLNKLYSRKWISEVRKTESQIAQMIVEHRELCPMKQIQLMDWLVYMPGSVLTKVDRATMAFGVEARVPFLSNTLVDNVLPLPYENNLSFKGGKSLLRLWVRPLCRSVNRSKRAFINPLHHWLNQQDERFFKENILTDALLDQPWFNPDELISFIKKETSGQIANANFIWNLILLNSHIEGK